MRAVTGVKSVDLDAVGRLVEAAFPEAFGVWIYGSVAHGRARATSDIDIALLGMTPIDLGARSLDRIGELGAGLGRDADVVDLRAVETVLRFEVVARGSRVAARDPWLCDNFELFAIKDFQRLNDGQREQLERIGRTGRVGWSTASS